MFCKSKSMSKYPNSNTEFCKFCKKNSKKVFKDRDCVTILSSILGKGPVTHCVTISERRDGEVVTYAFE